MLANLAVSKFGFEFEKELFHGKLGEKTWFSLEFLMSLDWKKVF